MRHIDILINFGLIEKEHRFYDDYVKREYGGGCDRAIPRVLLRPAVGIDITM
jgi:hypothetical protein